MPQATFTVRCHPNGKREFLVDFVSDSDAMAHEHEADHRRFVEEHLGELLGEDDVVVVRGGAAQVRKETHTTPAAPQRQTATNQG